MKLIKTIALWIIVGFFALLALVTIPSLACIIALVVSALIAPIEKWQNILRKFIRGKIKAIVIFVLIVLMFVTFPTTEPQSDADLPAESTPVITTEATRPTTESATVPTTESTAPPTTEATTPPTTEATTPPTTEATTPPTTEATTPSTTEATTPPTTEATTPPTTEATTPPTTEATTPPTEPPHVHSFSAATCTTPPTCSCGVTEGSPIGHSWKEATCSEPQTCIICGTTSGSAVGHSYSNGNCSTCGDSDPNHNQITYVLNRSSKKFHYLSCSHLPTENRQDTTMTRDEVIAQGYIPCGYCHP